MLAAVICGVLCGLTHLCATGQWLHAQVQPGFDFLFRFQARHTAAGTIAATLRQNLSHALVLVKRLFHPEFLFT